MAVQDASINAEDLETSMHVLGNAHAPVGPGEQHDGGAREYVDQPCCTNCLISTALAVILCRKRCDPGRVVSEFAFFPPDPPTYALGKGDGDAPPTVDQPGVSSLRFNYRELDGDPHFARFRNLDGAHGRPSCRLLFTRRKQKIPCFFFERPGASLCVLYLHANATDCGAMLPTYSAFGRRLRVHVLAVEYNGYGGADGSATVRDVEADAAAGYDEALRLGFAPDRVVLYGQSVGSGPACWLASRKPVAGVVLHSPIASGIRALAGGGACSPVHVYACLDPFNNLREVAKIDAPVFVIHGTADEEIPCAHGRMLADRAKISHAPYWVEGAGHNNLLEIANEDYFLRLADFLATIPQDDPPGPPRPETMSA